MSQSIKSKLFWFVGLYLASVLTVGGFVFITRWLLGLPI